MQRSRILIVDDEPIGRLALQTLLESEGYDLIQATNGQEAVRLATSTTPDLILLDVVMPDIDGYSVCQILREDSRTSEIPIYLITSLDDKEARLRGIEAGADDFITKPFDFTEFRARIKTITRLNRFRQLTMERAKFDQVITYSPTGILVLDQSLRIQLANPRAHQILGWPDETPLEGEDFAERLPQLDSSKLENQIQHVSKSDATDECFETDLVRFDGTSFSAEIDIGRFPKEDDFAVQLIIRDVSRRKSVESQLQYDSIHDKLTGLANRTLMNDRIARALGRIKRKPEVRFSLIMLNIDRFKTLNESLGFRFADQLLCDFALRVSTCLRQDDTLARLAGDEFGILIDETADSDASLRVAKRIHQGLEEPFLIGDQEMFVSARIGIAQSNPAYNGPDDILRDANAALSRAKASRSPHVIFDETMHRHAMKKLQLESDLRRALARDELLLNYQPIVSLRDESIAGFEALIRWQHSERGLVSPVDFIPLAEDTGLIIPIGEWVLEAAQSQLNDWHTQIPSGSDVTMSINLSNIQFSQPGLVDYILGVLDRLSLPPSSIKLEITESVLMENPETATTMLNELRDQGIRISLDDFGTGYSSLSYLHRFPIDTLKIDRSFVMRMTESERDINLVQSIIALAHQMQMDVVAEGIESIEDCERLKEMGCEYGQGYLFDKPLCSQEATDRLTRKKPKVAAS